MKPHPLLLLTTLFAVGTTPLLAQSIWTAGHGDIGIGYVGNEFEPHWHLGENNEEVIVDGVPVSDPLGFEYEPGDLIAQTSLSETRNSNSLWDPIGVNSGDTFYLFPETEDLSTPYVGIGTEELDPLDWSTNITLTLTGISGTGVTAGGIFSLYTLDSFLDPTFFMTTNDGITAGDAISVAANTHSHFNFAFTQLGTYNLTFEVSGTHSVDGPKTASATYTFEVVPEPGSLALFLLGSSALLLKRRRASAA